MQTTTVVEPSPRSRVMEIHQFNFGLIDSAVAAPLDSGRKRKRSKVDAVVPISPPAKKCMPLVQERKPFDLTPTSGMTSICGRRRDMEDAVAIHPSFYGEIWKLAQFSSLQFPTNLCLSGFVKHCLKSKPRPRTLTLEHLLIVCELLKVNLYEFHKFNRESGGEVYFTMPRLQVFFKMILLPHFTCLGNWNHRPDRARDAC